MKRRLLRGSRRDEVHVISLFVVVALTPTDRRTGRDDTGAPAAALLARQASFSQSK